MGWFGGSGKEIVDDENTLKLIGALLGIGTMRDTLPFDQRGWTNELGINVLLRSLAGQLRLEAGHGGKKFIDARSSDNGGTWTLKKYQPGDWEHNVVPTLKLTMWLIERGGLSEENDNEYWSAIERYRRVGDLPLKIEDPGAIDALVQFGR